MRILVSGVFDLFHYGHMLLIKKCRNLYPNDTLIIGLHSDKECENYKRLPILNLEERTKSVKVFGHHNEIIVCPLNETKEFYLTNKIDLTIHAHSLEDHDYYINNCYNAAHEMGIFKRLDYTSQISTSDIIKRIEKRNVVANMRKFLVNGY